MSTVPTVLLLGANGQLGSELQFTKPGDTELIACARTDLDIADTDALQRAFTRYRFQSVINASAYTAVDAAETEREAAHAVNTKGPARLADLCAAHGVRLLHISTDFIFDGMKGSPYRIDDTPNPLGHYGVTKLAGERAVLGSGADALVVRTGWVYSAQGSNFVRTMLRLMAERDRLSVVEDQVGTPTWARGLANVCWTLLADPGAYGCYHWSDAGACSWYDFAVAIADEASRIGLLDRAPAIVPIPSSDYPTPARRPAYSVLDKTGTRERLNYPGVHWREALRSMLLEVPHSSNGQESGHG
ncbi:dTDP-4-dehydrorhamnose reductase [Luminiphilus syltensis NOR5-1B]|uniref:dTDP-4-dehydrorhamnose reductase n=1 Tax=Luminiphilus syltensis NOR5-1B TaxID=565045 RepID=B8KUL0_9GAMM|nr:dTDP-4-dehydrorhamnose reductase [Luminiphilus syltensis]EED36653.1 dTDP-4-dehydrorhamnose reductase [Luminiphilus syltensis NOR5-1B]